MYDAHYDLLTILYFNFKKQNPLADKYKCISDCEKIYSKKNVSGGIINLYFMSPEEMLNELGITKEECENSKDMFKRSIKLLDEFVENEIIPEEAKFIYGIEGCDFIKDPADLLVLYEMGLRVVAPVWNNPNKYGSGNKRKYGLSYMGRKFVKLAIHLGMAIDVSHANEKTFNDIMDIVESYILKGEQPIVIASHSNARNMCDRPRNLTDEQINRLKKAGGYLGLFSNGNFVSLDNEKLSKEQRKENFVNMVSYVVNDLGYPKDKILLSTDDMNFHPDHSYHGLETFDLFDLRSQTKKALQSKFDESTINMFMSANFENLYNMLSNIKYCDFEKWLNLNKKQ